MKGLMNDDLAYRVGFDSSGRLSLAFETRNSFWHSNSGITWNGLIASFLGSLGYLR